MAYDVIKRFAPMQIRHPADDGLDAEGLEPIKLIKECLGAGSVIVGVEHPRTRPLDAVEVGTGLIAMAAENVELVRQLRRRAEAASVAVPGDEGERVPFAIPGDQNRRPTGEPGPVDQAGGLDVVSDVARIVL